MTQARQSARGANRRLMLGAVWLTIACLAQPLAAHTETGPHWDNLTLAQQQTLAPLRQDWQGIDAARKQKWLEVAGRFDQLPVAERSRIQQRMAEWARLPPAERARVRQQFLETRSISADERQARWQEYQTLPPEKRQQLAAQAQQREAQQRQAQQRSTPATQAPVPAVQAKANVLSLKPPPPVKVVTPSVLQARPGATTTTVATRPQAAAHQQAGLPKIAATPDFVDPTTLLPRRGAQAAARIDPPASAARVDPQ